MCDKRHVDHPSGFFPKVANNAAITKSIKRVEINVHAQGILQRMCTANLYVLA
jgi:hypothetical protein